MRPTEFEALTAALQAQTVRCQVLEKKLELLAGKYEELETVLFAVKAMFETVGMCFSEVARLDGTFPADVQGALKVVPGGKKESSCP